MATAGPIYPSPDGATYLAALAALAVAAGPLTGYAVHQAASDLLAPVLRPTATSIGRFLEQASRDRGDHPTAGLVETSETSSSRAAQAFRITSRGRGALHRSIVAPMSLATAIYGHNAFDAKLLLAQRYADGKHLRPLLDAQLAWLEENPVALAFGTEEILSAINQRRERERSLIIEFINALRKGG
ncbi:hypothetical protein KJ567_06805 [Candidatus Bipolaricaulota bacterium]|nr:hypothetical protein [Candidatus Bipolaricaulota bacterium]